MPKWLKHWGNKALHGAVIAAGTVIPMIVTGAVSPLGGAKMAVGAIVAYLLKPARPDDVSARDPIPPEQRKPAAK